ncbi:MAG: ATP-dependent DNA ligase [Candidatus Eremiobacteraeota bacterium]|nr:ATP-dependent DNA ligase [Candidatus Eremiobacteraeota bacterium]
MAVFARLVEVSQALRRAGGRNRKIELLADYLRSLASDQLGLAIDYLSGQLPQGKIGVGPSMLRQLDLDIPPTGGDLLLADVDVCLSAVAACSGAGSKAARLDLLQSLLASAGPAERPFLIRLLGGELRQGAQEGLMVVALAQALELPLEVVRRAFMLTADLARVARLGQRGQAELVSLGPELFRPLRPMLASPTAGLEEALARAGPCQIETKMDGVRVQVHRLEDRVRVYSRSLNDITYQVPEVVELARRLPCRDCMLDGEALALDEQGRPRPFQETMRRFGRRTDLVAAREAVPLSCYFFDCLWLDSESLIDQPLQQRAARLQALAPDQLVPRAEPDQAEEFFEQVLEAGHEGVMVKALDSAYEAGNRGFSWMKVKPAHTLDLVVLAAEWGSGRRQGWLSNLHLGARGQDGFVMLGKTFKGMTDEMLEWQTRTLLDLEVEREDYVVWVRPELVVEIAFDSLQASPHYPGGMALRFARVKTYRTDKSAEQADTIETVRQIFTQGRV